MAIATLQELNDLVSADRVRRQFPSLPHPLKVTVLDTVNQSGEAAYDVVLVYPDKIPDKDFLSGKISPIVDWIREQVFASQSNERWAYFRFRRENEDRN